MQSVSRFRQVGFDYAVEYNRYRYRRGQRTPRDRRLLSVKFTEGPAIRRTRADRVVA